MSEPRAELNPIFALRCLTRMKTEPKRFHTSGDGALWWKTGSWWVTDKRETLKAVARFEVKSPPCRHPELG